MKIKLAILERDTGYLNRIVSVFSTKFTENFEIYSFTDQAVALLTLDEAKIDVLLADDSFEIDAAALPRRCALAYLVESSDIDTVREQTAICKFQKAELIYKQVLGVFSENVESIAGIRFNENNTGRLVAFLSASGGTGCSTAAAAYAMHMAKTGKKILYLNLERFGSSTAFFEGEGQSDFSDVIYALKSRKGNIALKLESAVRRDTSGVEFYQETKMALDMAELSIEEITNLIEQIQAFGGYDVIVLDVEFSIDKSSIELIKRCDCIVFVSDGSKVGNIKTKRAMDSLVVIMEQHNETSLLMRSGILYNRFSSKTSRKLTLDIKEYGGIPRFEGFGQRQLVKKISESPAFDAIT